MKGYKFRLQSLLDARKLQLENAQLEFSRVQYKLQLETKKVEQFYEKLNETNVGLKSILSSSAMIDPFTVNNYNGYLSKLESMITNQHKIIADVEVELEDKKHVMLVMMKAKKILEKLKEKGLKEFNEKTEKHMMAEIDDMATSRYIRKQV